MYRMLIRERSSRFFSDFVFTLRFCSAPGAEKSFLSRLLRGGADTPARITITGYGYKNGGEVNNTRLHSGMNVDPSGRDNHSGPGRDGDHSQKPKRLS